MHTIRFFSLVFFLFIGTLSFGQEKRAIPTDVLQALDYLDSKEAPLPNGLPYRTEAITWQVFDIDKDGTDEYFIQTRPRYTQSPTIIILQKDKRGNFSRKLEGLAPGKLVPLADADKFTNLHNLGVAYDNKLHQKEPAKFKALVDSAANHGTNVVFYKNYAHADSRKNVNSFLDLTYLETPRTACGNFKFSQPEQILVGKVARKKANFFIARSDDRLYCYEIKGFSGRGFMNKTVSVVNLPADFSSLEVDKDQIKYITTKGKLKNLKI